MENYIANKFLYAQDNPPAGCSTYAQALEEMKAGGKSSHWIWYIFPQIAGLGHSELNNRYSLTSKEEVLMYYSDPTLKARMNEILQVILDSKLGIGNLMGSQIDAKKFLSSMTLFYYVTQEQIFKDVIEKKCWNSYCEYTKAKLKRL